MKNTCCFIGHRVAPPGLFDLVYKAVEEFALSVDRPVFLNGGMGDFDRLGARAVGILKKRVPDRGVSLRLVLPSYRYAQRAGQSAKLDLYDEILVCGESDGAHYKAMIGIRNRWMVEQSDVCIAYVNTNSGGAYNALRTAQRLGTVRIVRLAMQENGEDLHG